ncbi:hypothetical protein HK096_004157 [Nowakowskiella sp. JEL0078]|nr:hypothetical protein HK096_004157 [Nowakowskiella sp. JEL0078]
MAYRHNSRMSLQGSVHWMAPEVIQQHGYSAKVDIWSLGCLLLEMLTGGLPWQKFSETQAMWRLGGKNAPPIPESASDIAKSFLQSCFTIDPEQRPTASELLEHQFSDFEVDAFDFIIAKSRALDCRQVEQKVRQSIMSVNSVNSSFAGLSTELTTSTDSLDH